MALSNQFSPAVEIEQLTRRFGSITALDRVSLAIAEKEFFSLLGPSGCGKTTLLRIIAGLEIPDHGTVRIDGIEANLIPAHRRPVNTVFQSYALFPHLTVWENVAFGLRMRKVARAELTDRVRKVLDLVQIQSLSDRAPDQLSGGQKQRVALARAIVNEPKVLLLDEPLAALDLKLRKQLQTELLNLQRRLGITFIYVTHDQEEALILSDRIAVMREGAIEQVGAPQELYERPRTRFTSQFLGSCTLLEAKIRERLADGAIVDTALGDLRVTGPFSTREKLTLAIRPEKVQLSAVPEGTGENRIPMRVELFSYVGSETHYELRSGAQMVRAELMNTHERSRAWPVGQELWAHLPPGALIILDD